jgi:enoyl-CoA hydratase/carnithine racemase
VALARSIIDKPAGVVAVGKRFFYRQLEQRLDEAYRMATATITQNMLDADAQEGVRAFVEKRKPSWRE